ncbi:hypothetical protein BC332_06845 [Capsicum chinense]|nr:hypothetical protein BC332_06845 [Capsicum chinense]
MGSVSVGPVGKLVRSPWDERGRGDVAQIFVSYNLSTLCTLQFLFYEDGNKLVLSKRHGVRGGVNFNTIVFDYPSEFLTSIAGSSRVAEDKLSVLSSTTFVTNKGSYGPFGIPSAGAKEFNFQIGNYRSLGGFWGSINRHGIESFGVYVMPITTSMIRSIIPLVKFEKEEKD